VVAPRCHHLKTRMGSAALASTHQWTDTVQTKTRMPKVSSPLLTTSVIKATLAKRSMMRSFALAKAVLNDEAAKAEHLWRE
jgi:cellulase/cellobiase CelA1